VQSIDFHDKHDRYHEYHHKIHIKSYYQVKPDCIENNVHDKIA